MCLRLGLVLVKRREDPSKHSPQRFAGSSQKSVFWRARRWMTPPLSQTSANWKSSPRTRCGRHHDAQRAKNNCNAAGMRSVGERRFGREPRQDCRGAQWQPRARRCRCAAKSFPPSAPSPYRGSPSAAFPACGTAPKGSCMPFSPVFPHMRDYVTALPCAHARAPRAPTHTPMHTPPSSLCPLTRQPGPRSHVRSADPRGYENASKKSCRGNAPRAINWALGVD